MWGHSQGVNTEKYVPNPTASSPQALAMFEFVGRLMGIVLRHKFYLPFELPAMVRVLFIFPGSDTQGSSKQDTGMVFVQHSRCTIRFARLNHLSRLLPIVPCTVGQRPSLPRR